MAVPGGPTPNPMELEVTVVSAKHLKNVNWRNGDLHPYATFWVDPDRRISTKPDGSGSTKPVWNETFSLPISSFGPSLLLTLEIFHSNPSETPKPLVGTARVRLADLLVDSPDSDRLHSLDLIRPSGRPQGKVRIKIGLREQPPPPPPPPQPSNPPPGYPDFNFPPQSGFYYSSAPPPPQPQPQPQRDYRDYPPPPPMYSAPPPPASHAPPSPYGYPSYSDAYPGYYPGYYSRPPPQQPHRAFSGYGVPSGPSAPVESSPYEQRPGGGGVGTVTGAMGGLSLDERGRYEEEKRRYEEEKRSERAEESVGGGGGAAVRDNFSDYRGKY